MTAHQDISGKADKVSNATNGNFASLDSNGNLVDSGHKHSDYTGFYTKPSGGIPASDLASGVIPTVHNVPSGGTTGQILVKSSGTDYAMSWTTPGDYLPAVSSTDNNKVLQVANGVWAVVALSVPEVASLTDEEIDEICEYDGLPSASGVSF